MNDLTDLDNKIRQTFAEAEQIYGLGGDSRRSSEYLHQVFARGPIRRLSVCVSDGQRSPAVPCFLIGILF